MIYYEGALEIIVLIFINLNLVDNTNKLFHESDSEGLGSSTPEKVVHLNKSTNSGTEYSHSSSKRIHVHINSILLHYLCLNI